MGRIHTPFGEDLGRPVSRVLPKRTPPKSANHHKSSPERPPCYHGAMFFGGVVISPWPVDVRQTSTSRIWRLTWCQFLLPGRPTYRLKCYSAAAQNKQTRHSGSVSRNSFLVQLALQLLSKPNCLGLGPIAGPVAVPKGTQCQRGPRKG